MFRLAITVCFALFAVCSARQQRTLTILLQDRNKTAHSSSAAAHAAMLALDTDHSGKVEKSEIETFALQQGLSAADIAAEFKDLDTNGDGELEEDEILGPEQQVGQANPTPEVVQTEQELVAAVPGDEVPHQFAPTPVAIQGSVIETTDESTSALLDGEQLKIPETSAERIDVAADETVAATIFAGEDLLEESAMMKETRHVASNVLAETFAQSASNVLDQDNQNKQRILQLDARAQSLRGQIDAIANTSQAQTLAAAVEAESRVLAGARKRVHLMEDQANELKRQANGHRSKALEAMDKITQAQQVMRDAMAPV